jgi:hypothetical protein
MLKEIRQLENIRGSDGNREKIGYFWSPQDQRAISWSGLQQKIVEVGWENKAKK